MQIYMHIFNQTVTSFFELSGKVLFADLSCCLIFILASLCPNEEASLGAEMVADKIIMKKA